MQLEEFYTSDLDEGFRDPGIFKAIFMAGPPGAGKNLIINALGLKATGLKLQDIDHTMAYLNRARSSAEKLQHDDPGYEHSLQTTRRRQTVLQREMLGLIINTTGRDYESLMSLKKQLEEVGYDTFMLYVDVDEDIAWGRAQDRLTNATDPKDRGRPVDMSYFKTAYSAAKKNADFYAMMFGDQFAIVDNNADYGPRDTRGNLTNPDSKQQLSVLLRIASKKIQRFLQKPLSASAQAAVNAAKQARGVEV
jgi:hypothetical protein